MIFWMAGRPEIDTRPGAGTLHHREGIKD